jgi:hypothetical protein
MDDAMMQFDDFWQGLFQKATCEESGFLTFTSFSRLVAFQCGYGCECKKNLCVGSNL